MSVSQLSNAELDSLLTDLLGNPSNDNVVLHEPSASNHDDSNPAGIVEMEVGSGEQSVEQFLDQYCKRPNQAYSNSDNEICDLKLKVELLAKKLVDKSNDLDAKEEELAIVTCKLNNAEKSKERLEKKLGLYGNIIERMALIKSNSTEASDISMSTVVNENVVSLKTVASDELERIVVPVAQENYLAEQPRKESQSGSVNKSNNIKCRFENTGTCRKKNCKNQHPKKTCQNYSYYGVCSSQSCDRRHPWGVCYIWQQHGACFYGERCRNRHPIDLMRQQNVTFASENRFLGWNKSHHVTPQLQCYPPPVNVKERNN